MARKPLVRKYAAPVDAFNDGNILGSRNLCMMILQRRRK
jgi:hypothetical protein